jgi:hypothetical protein
MLRWTSTILMALILGASLLLAQKSKPPKGSPDEVLDQYFRMINEGDLLSPGGWKRAASLFVKPNERPKDETIFVTTRFPLGNGPLSVNDDRAEADEKWVDSLGTIDSAFWFHPQKKEPEVEGTIFVFHIVRTEKHWQTPTNGISEKQPSGPPQWRIEESPTIRWASQEAAIRYLSEMRDKTADPMVKSNADRTIAKLKSLPVPRTHI